LANLIIRVFSIGNPSWVRAETPTNSICKPRGSLLEGLRIEVRCYLCLTSLFCSLQEQLVPTVGHEVTPYKSTRTLSTMISTCSRAGVTKQPKAGPTAPASLTPDLVAILEGQAKMQQELVDMRKRSADEMEALRQENSRLRSKIEADPT